MAGRPATTSGAGPAPDTILAVHVPPSGRRHANPQWCKIPRDSYVDDSRPTARGTRINAAYFGRADRMFGAGLSGRHRDPAWTQYAEFGGSNGVAVPGRRGSAGERDHVPNRNRSETPSRIRHGPRLFRNSTAATRLGLVLSNGAPTPRADWTGCSTSAQSWSGLLATVGQPWRCLLKPASLVSDGGMHARFLVDRAALNTVKPGDHIGSGGAAGVGVEVAGGSHHGGDVADRGVHPTATRVRCGVEQRTAGGTGFPQRMDNPTSRSRQGTSSTPPSRD